MNRKPNRTCDWCGEPYYARASHLAKGWDRHCSDVCRENQKWASWRRECLICGKAFFPKPSQVEQGKGKYCSIECSAKAQSTSEKVSEKDMLNAKAKVKYALKIGRLTRKPCSVCGQKDSEAHHQDYSKPLDVIWFCRKHHTLWHQFLNESMKGGENE